MQNRLTGFPFYIGVYLCSFEFPSEWERNFSARCFFGRYLNSQCVWPSPGPPNLFRVNIPSLFPMDENLRKLNRAREDSTVTSRMNFNADWMNFYEGTTVASTRNELEPV